MINSNDKSVLFDFVWRQVGKRLRAEGIVCVSGKDAEHLLKTFLLDELSKEIAKITDMPSFELFRAAQADLNFACRLYEPGKYNLLSFLFYFAENSMLLAYENTYSPISRDFPEALLTLPPLMRKVVALYLEGKKPPVETELDKEYYELCLEVYNAYLASEDWWSL